MGSLQFLGVIGLPAFREDKKDPAPEEKVTRTSSTTNSVGFDYLLTILPPLVRNACPFNYVIIDEIDILLDSAQTPLISAGSPMVV